MVLARVPELQKARKVEHVEVPLLRLHRITNQIVVWRLVARSPGTRSEPRRETRAGLSPVLYVERVLMMVMDRGKAKRQSYSY